MDYDYATIEKKMLELPDDLQEAMVSFDTAKHVEDIGKRHGLLIDQIGALSDVTGYVMLGLVPGKDFLSTLMKKAEIDHKTAMEIEKDINDEIFSGIRDSLRKIEERETLSKDLEKNGGISVDKNHASDDVVSGAAKPVEQISQAATLNAIENPPAFVDKLLTGSSVSMNETVVKQAPASTQGSAPETMPDAETKPAQPAAPSAPRIDPYREPID